MKLYNRCFRRSLLLVISFVFIGGVVEVSGQNSITIREICSETNCTDGLDDDNDGLVDCLDSDCISTSVCDPCKNNNKANTSVQLVAVPDTICAGDTARVFLVGSLSGFDSIFWSTGEMESGHILTSVNTTTSIEVILKKKACTNKDTLSITLVVDPSSCQTNCFPDSLSIFDGGSLTYIPTNTCYANDADLCFIWTPLGGDCEYDSTKQCELLTPIVDSCDYFLQITNNLTGQIVSSEFVHVKTRPDTLLTEDLLCIFPSTDSLTLDSIRGYINTYIDSFDLTNMNRLAHFLAQAGHETNNFTQIRVEGGCFSRTNSAGWSIWMNNRWDNSLVVGCSDVTTATTAGSFRNTLFRVPLASIPCQYVCHCNTDNVNNLSAAMNLLNYGRRCMLGHGDENSGDGWAYRGRGLVQLTWKDNYEEFNAWLASNTSLNVDVVTNPDLVGTNMEIAVLSGLWYWQRYNLNSRADINDIRGITSRIHGDGVTAPQRNSIYNNAIKCLSK